MNRDEITENLPEESHEALLADGFEQAPVGYTANYHHPLFNWT